MVAVWCLDPERAGNCRWETASGCAVFLRYSPRASRGEKSREQRTIFFHQTLEHPLLPTLCLPTHRNPWRPFPQSEPGVGSKRPEVVQARLLYVFFQRPTLSPSTLASELEMPRPVMHGPTLSLKWKRRWWAPCRSLPAALSLP